jgi:CDP-diacylglycerol--glycerol-3-phosphate 3-phosphatidyltransferase
MRINVPNQITLGRLVLAVLFFALLSWFDASHLDKQRWLLMVSFWVFLVAVVSDIVDGLIARMTDTVTSFGRVVDPVVDKVIVCGAFVLFASHHFWDGSTNITGVAPWMVLVILVRELLVSAVRAHAESAGVDFSASWSGKIKMLVQSVTVCVILGQLAWDLEGLAPVRVALVWLTVIVTALSAVSYVRRAQAFLLSSEALGGAGGAAHGAEPPADAGADESATDDAAEPRR